MNTKGGKQKEGNLHCKCALEQGIGKSWVDGSRVAAFVTLFSSSSDGTSNLELSKKSSTFISIFNIG